MKHLTRSLIVVSLAACLAACGHSNDNSSLNSGGSTTPTNPTPPTGVVAGMLDSFGMFVASIIGTTSETASPVSIDSVAVTQPDNTQPAVVPQ